MEFYKDLSNNYDQMTRFQARMKREKEIINHLIDKYNPKSVLDVACGTGLHCILLAQAGISVTGTDISKAMLEVAQQNAKDANVKIEFIPASMQNLTDKINKTSDMILCLGNSIPHILESKDLEQSLNSFHALLNQNGVTVIQLLNYKRVLKLQERIVGIHKVDQTTFVRFYDFAEKQIIFNIITITEDGNKITHKLQSTPLYPYTDIELTEAFKNSGFKSVDIFGDLKLSDFDSESSNNLILIATK